MFMRSYRMTELLQDHNVQVYPTEYLISRLKGRATAMVLDWETVALSQSPYNELLSMERGKDISGAVLDTVWMKALKEIQWVYSQMNSGLRETFSPFFLYHEIDTIHLCMRFRLSKAAESKIEGLLSYGLLSETVRQAILRAGDIQSLLEIIESLFVPFSDSFRGIKEFYSNKNSKDVEQRFITCYLEHAVSSKVHPLIKRLFMYLIDMRNLMALYKHLRWGIYKPPDYVRGGSLARREINEVFAARDISDMDRLVHKVTSLGNEASAMSGPENCLLRGLTKLLRRSGRVDSDVGFILYYLWRCHVQARNTSLLLSVKELEREKLTGELIH